MIFLFFILTYKELTPQKFRKYCNNLLCQYFTILKLKKYRAAHIYIYIYICVYVYIYKIKGKVKVSNPTGHLRRQKNKKKPKQKCQNWAFKMTKKKKASTKVSNGEFAVLPQ